MVELSSSEMSALLLAVARELAARLLFLEGSSSAPRERPVVSASLNLAAAAALLRRATKSVSATQVPRNAEAERESSKLVQMPDLSLAPLLLDCEHVM